MPTTKYYTCVIIVNETVHTEATPGRYNSEGVTPAQRESTEIAKISVRADTLESMCQKIAGHVDLLED